MGAWPATYAALITLVVATIIGLALALLESWIDVSRRMRVWFGLVTLGLAVAGLALGVSRLPPDAAVTAASWWADTARPHDWSHGAAGTSRRPSWRCAIAAGWPGSSGSAGPRRGPDWPRPGGARSGTDEPDRVERAPRGRVDDRPTGRRDLLGAARRACSWTWNTPFTALPALLLFAIAVAEVDARAHVLWPGWSSRVRRTGTRLWGTIAQPPAATPEDHRAARGVDEATVSDAQQPFTTHRRTDQYERRRRRRARRERTLRPPGPLSAVYRWLVLIVSAIGVGWLTWVYVTLG